MKLIFFICFLFLGFKGYSATGCLIGNKIYTNQYTGLNATIVIVFVTYGNYRKDPILSTISTDCPRADNLVATPGLINLCLVESSLLGFGVGSIYNYEHLQPPTQCPIDDYIPYILLATAGFGFIYLRHNSFTIK